MTETKETHAEKRPTKGPGHPAGLAHGLPNSQQQGEKAHRQCGGSSLGQAARKGETENQGRSHPLCSLSAVGQTPCARCKPTGSKGAQGHVQAQRAGEGPGALGLSKSMCKGTETSAVRGSKRLVGDGVRELRLTPGVGALEPS